MAVIIPATGVAPAAIASETERGMETRETVTPAFQFCFNRPEMLFILSTLTLLQ